MRNIVRLTGLLVLALTVVGCGSSPRSSHYVLSAKSSQPPTENTPSLGIGPITIPEYLNRNSLVYNREGNKLTVSSTERWAEPLEDGLQRVISLNLSTLLGTHNIRFFPWSPQRAPDYGIKINLLNLGADDREAVLMAEWLIFRPEDSQTVMRRISRIVQPMPAGPIMAEEIAPAYSELLYQLSEIIATEIRADLQAQ